MYKVLRGQLSVVVVVSFHFVVALGFSFFFRVLNIELSFNINILIYNIGSYIKLKKKLS